MPHRVLDLLEAHKTQLVTEIIDEVRQFSPHYAQVPTVELRRNVVILLTLLFDAARSSNERQLMNTLAEISEKRVKEDLDMGGFLNAIHAVFPVFSKLVREKGDRENATLGEAYRIFENRLHQISSRIATLYSNTMQEKFTRQNQELKELNRLLQMKKDNLSRAVEKKDRALTYERGVNQRVLESMQSGVFVVSSDLNVIYFSERLGEMLDIDSQSAVGKNIQEVFKDTGGLDIPAMAAVVYRDGRLPLSLLEVTTSADKNKKFYVRAETYAGYDQAVDGVVLIVEDITEKELLTSSFKRYVSEEKLTQILKEGGVSAQQRERVQCTILFAKVRGFTPMAEKMSLENLHELINVYYGIMGNTVEKEGGFIDKFIGDKLLAVFQSTDDSKGAKAALQAALQIQEQMVQLETSNDDWPPLSVGVGVNTGQVLIGNVGNESRLDFTVLGDAVNVADRLQALAMGGEILCGDETAALGEPEVKSFMRSTEVLAGRSKPTQIFQVERRRKPRG